MDSKHIDNYIIQAQDASFQNYILNFNLEQNLKLGVFACNKEILSSFLLTISGIKRIKNINYQDNALYDNPDYFSRRIYIDTEIDYFATYNVKAISETIENEFNKTIDSAILTKILKEIQIRREVVMSDEAHFSPKGKTFMALASAFSSNNLIIINNTFNHLNEKEREIFKTYFLNHKEGFIISLDNLMICKNFLDNVLIIGDINFVFLNPKTAQVYLHDKCDDFKEKILFTNCLNNKYISFDLSKEMRKHFDHKRLRYQKINFYDIEKYLQKV